MRGEPSAKECARTTRVKKRKKKKRTRGAAGMEWTAVRSRQPRARSLLSGHTGLPVQLPIGPLPYSRMMKGALDIADPLYPPESPVYPLSNLLAQSSADRSLTLSLSTSTRLYEDTAGSFAVPKKRSHDHCHGNSSNISRFILFFFRTGSLSGQRM